MSLFRTRPAKFLFLALSALLVACAAGEESVGEDVPLSSNLLTLTSPAFGEGERIPARYTCDGADEPPPLTWTDIPTGVATYALVMDDPDAPGQTWVHWVLFNIPEDIRELPDGETSSAGVGGENSWGDIGYGGPCPPDGEHRYFFKLYALDVELDLAAGADKDALLGAIEGHVLAQGQLMGTYERE